jgi:DNA-directed RNA polymerase specialized sigma24 family protein
VNLIEIQARVFGPASPTARLCAADERTCIALAREHNDSEAFRKLAESCVPALRKAARSALGAIPDEDELFGVLILALWACVRENDGRPLAGMLWGAVRERVNEHASANGTAVVPRRTADRYEAVMRAAEGDAGVALTLAPEHQMSREAFLAVHAARTGAPLTAALEEVMPLGSLWPERTSAESRVLARVALDALNEQERGVVADLFGFSEYRCLEPGEVAVRHGITEGRVKTVRRSAMVKMRDALGVAQ